MPNYNIPISLKHIQHIIDKVSDRYPLLSKAEITLIIKTFFISIREILLAGDILSLNNFFSHMHLISFDSNRKSKFLRIIKVKLSTSKKIKNG
jgi:hypothetical protein